MRRSCRWQVCSPASQQPANLETVQPQVGTSCSVPMGAFVLGPQNSTLPDICPGKHNNLPCCVGPSTHRGTNDVQGRLQHSWRPVQGWTRDERRKPDQSWSRARAADRSQQTAAGCGALCVTGRASAALRRPWRLPAITAPTHPRLRSQSVGERAAARSSRERHAVRRESHSDAPLSSYSEGRGWLVIENQQVTVRC